MSPIYFFRGNVSTGAASRSCISFVIPAQAGIRRRHSSLTVRYRPGRGLPPLPDPLPPGERGEKAEPLPEAFVGATHASPLHRSEVRNRKVREIAYKRIPRPLRHPSPSSTINLDRLDPTLVEGLGVGCKGQGDIGVRFDRLNELRGGKISEPVEGRYRGRRAGLPPLPLGEGRGEGKSKSRHSPHVTPVATRVSGTGRSATLRPAPRLRASRRRRPHRPRPRFPDPGR